MRLVHLSDTHRGEEEIPLPEGDLLIHSGDVDIYLEDGNKSFNAFSKWLERAALSFPLGALFVPGNHDFYLEKNQTATIPGVEILIDRALEIKGHHFYGSPWTPVFGYWAFMKPEYLLSFNWSDIPPETEVLITHGPPFGILDTTDRQSVGSKTLREKVLLLKPKVHLFGHIHESYGSLEFNGTTFYNGSMENYEGVARFPWVIDI